MWFILHQYRVLSAIIRFGYKTTGTKSSISPYVKEIPVWLPYGTVFKHCCYLHRFGYIILHEPANAKVEANVEAKGEAAVKGKVKGTVRPNHHAELTSDGLAWYLAMKSAYTQSAITYLGSILMLVLGVIIGKVL